MMSQAGYPRNYRRDDSDYFVSSAVQVEYNAQGRASFIGIAPHARIELLYHGVDLLRTPAKQVFDLIQKNESQQDDAEYSPLEYLFPDQIITLWAADKQYDLNGERTPAWGQIGIGDEGYLNAINALKR
jgi:hypothetical protein